LNLARRALSTRANLFLTHGDERVSSQAPEPAVEVIPQARPKRTIATYRSYADAERAVDYLADHGFEVEHTQIVGRNLQLVEQVLGRVTYARVALAGALMGGITGLLVGWLFGVFDWSRPIVAAGWLALDGFWFGAVAGALLGLLWHAATAGRRDFASVRRIEAQHYDLMVDDAVADDALRLIAVFEDRRIPGR
jgi:hypothetical protein